MSKNSKPDQLAMMQQMLDMAAERTKLAQQRTKMATDRTKMAAERSEMSAERSYMAAERTLSVWVRTALSLMVFGIAIDRFGLLLGRQSGVDDGVLDPNGASMWGGVALVALGVIMVATTGVRFMAYVAAYRRNHGLPLRHGPFLTPVFAVMVAGFGVALIVLMLVFAR